MNLLDKIGLVKHIAVWKLSSGRFDLDYKPRGINNPKFVSAREAVNQIKDGQVVTSGGMAGNGRCSIYYMAVRDSYDRTGHPANLTWISVGAQGSRGRVPGTVEDMDAPGLVTKYIAGHHETVKTFLRLGDEGHVELHTLPQGMMVYLMEAQSKGVFELEHEVGLNTFLDPRVGNGSAVTPNPTFNLVEEAGDKLRFRLPKIEVAIFNAPYADAEGNIYHHHAATTTENWDSAMAAHHNGGKVMVTVGGIIDKDESLISIPKECVDCIVVDTHHEQAASVRSTKYWPMFTKEHKVDMADAVAKVKFLNDLAKITPKRGPVENALARTAASLFATESKPGSLINIGIGLPEEVGRLLYESDLFDDLTFTSETGNYGGLPTPGIFFGAAINPERMEKSSWMFREYEKRLNISVLGILEVDSEGNVNVSKRGPRMYDFVGPGGFPNIVYSAPTIIFVGSWMARAEMDIRDGKLVIKKPGKVKFVDKVDQITFSGKQGLKMGKKVFYVTNVGVFRLTERGLELYRVMPGVDIQKDILDVSGAKVLLPESGEVPLVDHSIFTGEGYQLSWPKE